MDWCTDKFYCPLKTNSDGGRKACSFMLDTFYCCDFDWTTTWQVCDGADIRFFSSLKKLLGDALKMCREKSYLFRGLLFSTIQYSVIWYSKSEILIVSSRSIPVVVLGWVPKWIGWDNWRDKWRLIWVLWV